MSEKEKVENELHIDRIFKVLDNKTAFIISQGIKISKSLEVKKVQMEYLEYIGIICYIRHSANTEIQNEINHELSIFRDETELSYDVINRIKDKIKSIFENQKIQVAIISSNNIKGTKYIVNEENFISDLEIYYKDGSILYINNIQKI